jgi:uncharacterized protein (DUF1800 family)
MKRIIVSFAAMLIALQPEMRAASVTGREASRLLDQAAWGPTPADIAQVQSLGFAGWIASQFQLNLSELPNQPILAANGNANTNLNPVRSAFFQNAISGQDQLRQRVAFALSGIWVVSQQSGVRFAYAFPPYWQLLSDNAFGNYADIVKAVTLSPAMGRYLNMANNNKGNPAKGIAANENYGRELMQLFTLGLTQLNADGSPVLDQNHKPVPTYTEAEVQDMAKALTGWTYPPAPGGESKANNPEYYFGPMLAVAANHDRSQKTLFGNYTIPAGQTPEQDLDSVINALMQQPSMAPFVCRQLIEHLVTSNPGPAYIQRVSGVFLNNGSGVRGDMKAVITAILMDPEARAGDDPNAAPIATAGHLREPVLLMAAMLRGLNALAGPQNTIAGYASTLGQNLFFEPSVFSYFSPNSRTEKGLYGPEFQIYTTQTSVSRANTIYTALYGSLDKDTKINLTPFNQKSKDLNGLIDYIDFIFLHHAASADLKANALAAAQAASTAARAVQSALFVMLTSAEYQVIH